jgi:hypothetical protein
MINSLLQSITADLWDIYSILHSSDLLVGLIFKLNVFRSIDIRPYYEVMGGDIDLLIPVDHDVEMTARLTFSQGELPNMDDYVMIQTLSKKLVVNVKFPKQGHYKLTLFIKN